MHQNNSCNLYYVLLHSPYLEKPSVISRAINWLKGVKFGLGLKDKIFLFICIVCAIVVRDRTDIFTRIPRPKSILIKRCGIILSIPSSPDGITLVKQNWEQLGIKFVTNLELKNNKNNYDNVEYPSSGNIVGDIVIIDVGAYVGFYTLMLAHFYPHAKVIAIEPSPTTYKILKSNCLEINKTQNVVLINKAISNADDETVDFYLRDSESTLLNEYVSKSGSSTSNTRFKNIVKVKTLTIDRLISTMNLKEISLLKVDIEGAEVLALNGASSALKQRKIKNLMIEYHSVHNYEYIIELLDKLNYTYLEDKSYKKFQNKEYVNGYIMAAIKPI
jgi:FkbM family methyltransferase